MTDDDTLQNGFDALVAAVDNLDEARAQHAAELLVAALDGAPEGVVDEVAEAIVGVWMDAEELWPDDPDERRGAIGALLIKALIVLGDRFPRPIFAGAYEQEALALLADDPVMASRLSHRAADLAEDADEAAGYRGLEALALGLSGRLEDGLALARHARAEASGLETIDGADRVVLELMHELGLPEAAQYAAEVFRRRGADMPDDLAESVVRVMLQDSMRVEAEHLRPPPEMTGAFRLALDRPAWRPDVFTEADWAVVVAWIEFLADDRDRLAETLARAGDGPFSDATLLGYARLLDAMVAFDAMDLSETERRLQRAAPIVQQCGDPKLTSAYRSLAQTLLQARRPASPSGAAWIESDRDLPPLLHLFQQAYAELATQRLTPETSARLRQWRQTGERDGDPMLTGAMWGIAAIAATLEDDAAGARDCLGRARSIAASFPTGSPIVRWLHSLIDGIEPALLMRSDREAAIAGLRATRDRLRNDSRDQVAVIANTQLAALLLPEDPRESLACAVQALTDLRHRRLHLPGSSERQALRDSLETLPVSTALRAAALIDDPRLTAELLEFLRAQDLPVVHIDPSPTELPLVLLMPPAPGSPVFFADDPSGSTDPVELPEPVPVMMPWGRVALVDLIGQQGGSPALLVVPR